MVMTRIFRAGLWLAFMVASSAAATAQQVTTVKGVVRNETGRPVEYAQVTLDRAPLGREVRTDRDGRFQFLGVPAGTHAIRVAFVGFRPHDRSIEIQGGGVVEVEIVLESVAVLLPGREVTARRTGLYGTVIARDSLLPVPDASIEVIGARKRDTTSADGTFNFPDLKAGSYLVRVRHTQFESRLLSVVIPQNGGKQMDLVVQRGLLNRDAHMEMMYRELDSRIQWHGQTAAFITREELRGEPTTGIDVALPTSASFMKASFYTAREGLEGACLFVDGEPRPGAKLSDFSLEQIEAIEVYGDPIERNEPTKSLQLRWPPRAMCGEASGPRVAFSQSKNTTSARLSANAKLVRFAVIWLK